LSEIAKKYLVAFSVRQKTCDTKNGLYEINTFFNLGARCDGWSMPDFGRFTPGKDPVPIVQKNGWAAGPVWTGAENLASAGFRSSDRPARSVVTIPTELSRHTNGIGAAQIILKGF